MCVNYFQESLSRDFLTELLMCPSRSMDPRSPLENCDRPCSELHYYVAYVCMCVCTHTRVLINIYHKLGSRLKISRVVKLIFIQ